MSAAAELLALLGFVAAGAALGLVYCLALWRAARRLCDGGALAAAGLTALRVALLIGGLTAAALHGAAPLLCVTLGLLAMRTAVLRRLGGPP